MLLIHDFLSHLLKKLYLWMKVTHCWLLRKWPNIEILVYWQWESSRRFNLDCWLGAKTCLFPLLFLLFFFFTLVYFITQYRTHFSIYLHLKLEANPWIACLECGFIVSIANSKFLGVWIGGISFGALSFFVSFLWNSLIKQCCPESNSSNGESK